jgi:tetratricopeptide (TPR) repeat protein
MAATSDIFISYARTSSRDDAQRLADALRQQGQSVFLDENEIGHGEVFPSALATALLDSRAVVIFAHQTYFDSAWCVREFELALSPLRSKARGAQWSSQIVVGLPREGAHQALLSRFPPSLARQSWPTAHETDALAGLVIERLRTSKARLRDVLGPAAEKLTGVVEQAGAVPAAGDLTPIRGYLERLPRSLKDRFVGRDNELWRLQHSIGTRKARSGAAASCAIHGFGGIGKTQLAAEYVWRYGPLLYTAGIVWIDASVGEPKVQEQIADAMRALGGLDGIVAAASHGSILWVVDNVPETGPPKPLDTWCPPRRHVTLLCTSRRAHTPDADESLLLDQLAIEDAVTVLTTPPVDTNSIANDGWEDIARWVGCMPLALRVLHLSLAGGFATAADLLARSRDEEPALAVDAEREALRGEVPDETVRGIAEALHAAYGALSTARDNDQRQALHVLARCAWPWDNLALPRMLGALGNRGWLQPVGADAEATSSGRWTMHPVLRSYVRARSPDAPFELAILAGWWLGLPWDRPAWMQKERHRVLVYGQPRGGVDLLMRDRSQPLESELRSVVVRGLREENNPAAMLAAEVLGALADPQVYDSLVAALSDPGTRGASIDLLGCYVLGATMQPAEIEVTKKERQAWSITAESIDPRVHPRIGHFLAPLFKVLYAMQPGEAHRAAAAIGLTDIGAKFLQEVLAHLSNSWPPEKLVALCDIVIEAKPGWAVPLFVRALVNEKSGQSQVAIADYTRTIAAAPDNPIPYLSRGKLLEAAERPSEAVDDFRRYVALKPSDAYGHQRLATSLIVLERWTEAAESAGQAIHLKPDDAFSWTLRAIARSNLNDEPGAIEDVEHALALEPKNELANDVRSQLDASDT